MPPDLGFSSPIAGVTMASVSRTAMRPARYVCGIIRASPPGSFFLAKGRAPPVIAAARCCRPLLEPDILKARAVVDAVDHLRQALDTRQSANCSARVEDDRPDAVFHELLLDLPHQLATLFQIGFRRLAVDHSVELRIAVTAVIALGAAYEILVELLVGIVEAVLADDCADREILAHHLRVPVGRVDRVELAVDIDFL